jgi:NADPH-dependent glutamate synthase beta subunit-like oxidoreductase
MSKPFLISIDGSSVEVAPDQTVLAAARALGLDIPTLCYLEKCGPLNSCLVCLVKINGKLVPSCGTRVQPGMIVESETEEVHAARRTALELLFSDHVGDCLSPCHRLCPLGLNIPVMLRQLQGGRMDEASATVRSALPLAGVLGRLCHHPCEQGCRRGNWDDPAAIRDMERSVTEWEHQQSSSAKAEPTVSDSHRATASAVTAGNSATHLLRRKPPSGKTVAVIGAGPTGLSAAWQLTREGHSVTVVDRHTRAGGALRLLPEDQLPAATLAAEIDQLTRAGVEFKLGVELGADLSIDGLSRGFDAILLASGEMPSAEREKLGLPGTGTALKADPNTCQTPMRKVFAGGAAVKPIKQLVRAMAEGKAVAECVHRFLCGQPVRRPEKVFSSIMGRLEVGELRTFLATASPGGCVTPCDRCAGLSPREASAEASRCLHCDCRSSGNCVLQHYAQVYGAEASRFRTERKTYEQHLQPGGIVFEPGKCILCGICVKLTELAREPLGLTFIGRGFDVRIGTPLNGTIEEGLQKVAAECVKHCPTGALEWASSSPPPQVPEQRPVPAGASAAPL